MSISPALNGFSVGVTVLSLRVVLGGLPSKTFSGKSTGLLENKSSRTFK
ncbi:Uncharacterised protein [Mycobacteroides abscessus subsp. massiliense]|nr:Uncharacterised protein [Mycobacteroides abscessus subsp. massiliense]